MTTQAARIDVAVREYLAHAEVTGLAIAVAQQGQMVFCSGYGVQNRDTMQPVTPATLFHLASVVKTMTSTAIMQLREAGKLDLDDPVVAHLPYFRVDDPRSDQITLRQCLSHTSGIEHPTDWGWDRPEFDDAALERHVRSLAARPLIDVPPGTTAYSDIAYNVLGAVIAHVSGLSYEAYLQRHLFQPLGMTQTTTMAPRQGDPALLATGYEHDESGVIRQSLYPYNRMHVPCGCVASNVLEMTRYATAHLNAGVLDGARILAPASYDAMWAVQVHTARETARADSALGWWVRRGSAERIVEHDGEDDGFLSYFCLWPERHQSIVVLCNATWADLRHVTGIVADLLADGR
ncbi:MAG: beta-lactamase family protein [Chloroflexales bacterium]|nr:beta-lactamase family protein [Chloroflexales bacterium]